MTGDDYYQTTDEAATFISARLDELETTANAAGGSLSGRWRVDDDGHVQDEHPRDGNTCVACGLHGGVLDAARAAHIARNDPATVLASIAADRQLLDTYVQARNTAQPDERHHGYLDAAADRIRLRTAAWARHPAYKRHWSL